MSQNLNELILPCIHLNGSSKDSLVDGYCTTIVSINRAIELLIDCSPNARDYYPLGDDAFKKATEQHKARIQKLRDVLAEISYIAEETANK